MTDTLTATVYEGVKICKANVVTPVPAMEEVLKASFTLASGRQSVSR